MLPVAPPGRNQMARKKLTDTFIRSRKPAQPKHPDDKNPRDETMDTEHPRLGFRITNTGHKSFFYLGRFPGSDHPTRRLIGDYPATTLTRARETARAWDALLTEGTDPAVEQKRLVEEKKRKAREETLASANVFEARARQYLREHCKDHRQATRQAGLSTRSFCPSGVIAASTRSPRARSRITSKPSRNARPPSHETHSPLPRHFSHGRAMRSISRRRPPP